MRFWSPLLALAVLTAALPAAAQSTAPASQPTFLFIYSPGPAWKPGLPASQQALAPHGAYMVKLAGDGRLLAGGPLLDADGGVAIVRAPDAAAARAILAADPSIVGGIMKAEVHGWTPIFGTGEPLPVKNRAAR
jgi:uncharacterized protein YciI